MPLQAFSFIYYFVLLMPLLASSFIYYFVLLISEEIAKSSEESQVLFVKTEKTEIVKLKLSIDYNTVLNDYPAPLKVLYIFLK